LRGNLRGGRRSRVRQLCPEPRVSRPARYPIQAIEIQRTCGQAWCELTPEPCR
jgi:hypothetical protein